jgi:hypothetical protein
VIEQRIDDRALRHGAAVTLVCHLFQHLPDLAEIFDLPLDLLQMMNGDALHPGACVSPPVDER